MTSLPAPSSEPRVIRRKAHLARSRSKLVWPSDLSMAARLRVEACSALRWSITDYWRIYRRSRCQETRAKIRGLLAAKITAVRLFSM